MNALPLLQNACWISSDLVGSPMCGVPAPVVERTFTLDTPVEDAVLRWTCLGLAEVTLDGQPLHDGVFLPGWTDYAKRLRVLEVHTGPLTAGEHTLKAVLGDGWAVGHIANLPRQYYSDRPCFRAELRWQGGSLMTDDRWVTYPSPVIANDLLQGEIVDARIADRTQNRVPVTLPQVKPPPLTLHTDPVVKRQETFSAELLNTDGARKLYDLGQNFSGRMRIRVRGERGATVVLRHAEILQPDGSPYFDNLRGAKATDMYTLSGHGEETWEPCFTFHGFRYVSVDIKGGEVEILGLTGIALYTEMERTGEFRCSDELLNQLFHNIVWGQNSNFLEIPTDCPQRDERLGWTGDAQVFAPTAAFIRDVSPFFKKWLTDLRDAQFDHGGIPRFAPDVGAFGLYDVNAGPAWADAMVLIPWYLYEATGDVSFLADNYDTMVRYMEHLDRELVQDGICYHPDKRDWLGFGDWLALDGSGQLSGITPKDLIGTAFYARNAELLASMAEILGNADGVTRWKTLHSETRKAFQHRFLTPEGIPTGATQTSCILALHFNLVTDEQREGCVQELVRRINPQDPKIGTGFVGTPYICQVLEDNGQLDLAYQLLERKAFPSWLFPVTQGATTIWERWDGWHPERGFQTPGMNSFNHYAYGAVGEWMVRTVAGLAPEAPGYKVIRFKPRPGGSITEASASLNTQYGPASISWKQTDTGLHLDLRVPEDTTAILDLSGAEPEALAAGQYALSR